MSQSYAAWWYCVIPVSVIDREGLPLPIFVRTDDVEYSLRAHAKIMTMNGICVWHAPFKQRYSAAVERYQMPRNVLIGQFTSGMAPMSDFIGDLKIGFELELKKYNYDNAALVLDAFEDFLKGPSFIMEKGAPREAILTTSRRPRSCFRLTISRKMPWLWALISIPSPQRNSTTRTTRETTIARSSSAYGTT